MKKFLHCLSIFLVCTQLPIYAAAQVRINEILIDPNQSIELYNNENHDINISGWFLDDSGGTTYFEVPPNTILPSQRCIVFTSSFSLNKTTPDTARLFDATATPTEQSSKLIDSFAYSTSPGNTMSFQRIPDGEPIWATAPASLGLRNLDDTSCIVVPTPTVIPTVATTPTPTSIVASSINNIFISEAGVNPLSSTGEWVELFNNNEYEVALDGWFLDDIRSGGATKVEFSRALPSKSYVVIELDASLFNNSGDEINLLNNNEQLMDAVAYTTSVKGMSVGRTELLSVNACIMQPTLTLPNSACVVPTSLPTPTPKVLKTSPTTTPKPPVNTNAVIPKPEVTSNSGKVIGTTNKQKATTKISQKSAPSTGEQAEDSQSISITTDEPRKIARTLSFSSLSASVLTIISLLFKMRGE